MRLFPLFALALGLAACANPLALDADHFRLQVLASVENLPDDPLTIAGARVVGTNLELDLQYGGGCGDHRFAMVAGRALAESLPPFTLLRIAHDGSNDGCTALVNRSIVVDLTPIAALVRAAGSNSLRFELVEPGEKLSKVGVRRVDF